jgi:hypothetical protein
MWIKYIAPIINELSNLVKTLDTHQRGAIYITLLLGIIGASVACGMMIYYHGAHT